MYKCNLKKFNNKCINLINNMIINIIFFESLDGHRDHFQTKKTKKKTLLIVTESIGD